MIDTGSTGFMLLATSLVMLMTPGLAFFYGGLASKRNILGIMIQSFVSMGWTTVLQVLFGYSLCFSGGEGAIIGDFGKAFLHGINANSMYTNGKIPEFVFFAYQMMFAIITPALITGAFVNRINFKAYLIFLTFWQILVYYPFVHMVWGGGLLAQWGVLDFAGGIVVHATAGFAALASVFFNVCDAQETEFTCSPKSLLFKEDLQLREMVFKLVQLSNAAAPMFVTLSGIVMLVKLLQLQNA